MPATEDDRAWYIRAAAARALGKLGEKASLEPLLVALEDEHEMVRAIAIHTAGLPGSRIPLKKIVSALQDPAWHVREVAALTLGRMDKRVPPEPLIAALNDAAAPVRVAAWEALQRAYPDLDSILAGEWLWPQKATNGVSSLLPLSLPTHFWQPELETRGGTVDLRLPGRQRERKQRMETNHTRFQPGKLRLAYLSTVAAVVCLVLLVGSLLLTFNLIQRSKNGTTGQPVTEDNTPHLYVTSANSIFKVNISSGAVIWKYTVKDYIHNNINPLNQETIETPVIVGDGMVYFEAQNHSIYALDATNGKLLWRKANNWGGVLNEVNGVLFITSDPTGNDDSIGELLALNARDGSERWHYQTQHSITGETVDHGTVYITEYNHLEAINAANGAFLWKAQVPKAGHDFFSEPRVVNNILYMQYVEVIPPGLPVCYEYAFDPVKGSELWHSQRMDGVISSATIAHSVMYFGSENHTLYALSARDGHQLWQANAGGSIESSPQVANGVVYVGEVNYSRAPNRIVAFNATNGNLLWSKEEQFFGAAPNNPLVLNNGLIYFGTAGTTEANVFDTLHIYALRASDGSIVKSYKLTGANSTGDPTVMIVP